MLCAAIKTYGEAVENLVIEERADVHATAGSIRVRVAATALNRADLLQRRGLYPPPPDTPDYAKDVPGLEFTGVVDELGAGVKRWRGGENVFGIVSGGGYASQIITHPDLVAPVPEGLDAARAAAVPEAFFTAFDGLVSQAAVEAGERVLIHAVASGVGTAALQIARARGAEVAGTAGSRFKLARVGEIAPFFAINYRELDFKEAIEHEFGERSIDVILDVVGGPYWRRNLELLATKGRLVLVGRMGGSQADTPLDVVMAKRLRIFGTVMRARSLHEKIAVTRAFEEHLLPLFDKGELEPVVDSVYPFREIHKATSRMENNENVGKIVLTFPPDV